MSSTRNGCQGGLEKPACFLNEFFPAQSNQASNLGFFDGGDSIPAEDFFNYQRGSVAVCPDIF